MRRRIKVSAPPFIENTLVPSYHRVLYLMMDEERRAEVDRLYQEDWERGLFGGKQAQKEARRKG